MSKVKNLQKNIEPRQVLLYRNVFCSRVSTAVVLCLCFSFLLQPVERIYASTEVPPTEENILPILGIDAGLDVDGTVLTEPVSQVDEISTTATTIPESDDMTGSDSISNDDPIETATSTGDIATTTTPVDELDADEVDDGLPQDNILDEEMTEEILETSTSTDEEAISVSVVYSDAVMQFNKTDCVTVEDGSFYCQTKQEQTEAASDGMYALQDIDGDLEIFLQKNGELTQLTFNTVDDAAPYFDSKSNSIVWHRLVDDRYQIISYNLDTEEEVQLTAENVNNMEPSRSGDYTVWQRWNNNNWDIVLYDGFEIKYLTDSSFHDLAPRVKGDLVMWNRLTSDNVQTIELYDIATHEYTTISDTEGGALSNPRMVLVYETEFANGDVVTKGYDIDTGEITPLTTTPADLPEELPEPDATGETRALLQVKNLSREDGDISEDGLLDLFATASGTPPVLAPGDLVVATSSTLATTTEPLNQQASSTQFVSDTTLTLDLTTTVAIEENSMELIIAPFATSTTMDTATPTD